MNSERKIPVGRLNRMGQIGRLAGRVALNSVAAGAREVRQGRRPGLSRLLLQPANVEHLADRLAEMRGAAMKLGQLLSMESGEVLPRELSDLLARLRESAYAMPWRQLEATLESAWGSGWQKGFQWFSARPAAAASIGQVHEAMTLDGRRLAVKVQYPGVRASIDSDLDNVLGLLRIFRLLPEVDDLDGLIATAREQLTVEADYCQESAWLQRFSRLLRTDDRFQLPDVMKDLSTADVLAMEYLDGDAIETVADLSRNTRDEVGHALLELSLRELFEWGLVQTDANFANYRFNADRDVIQLLDFGAVRAFPPERVEQLRALLLAARAGDDAALLEAAEGVGYLGATDTRAYREAVLSLLRTATEPLRANTPFDFGVSDLARRMTDVVIDLRVEQRNGRIPPADVLFLHRKLGGLYLLLKRIGARVDLSDLLRRFEQAPRTGLDESVSERARVDAAVG